MHRFAQWEPTLIVVRGDEPTRERRRRLRHERCRVDRSRGRRVVQRALAYGLHRHRPETGDESRTEGVGRAATQNSKFENLSSFPVWPRDLWPRVDLCCVCGYMGGGGERPPPHAQNAKLKTNELRTSFTYQSLN